MARELRRSKRVATAEAGSAPQVPTQPVASAAEPRSKRARVRQQSKSNDPPPLPPSHRLSQPMLASVFGGNEPNTAATIVTVASHPQRTQSDQINPLPTSSDRDRSHRNQSPPQHSIASTDAPAFAAPFAAPFAALFEINPLHQRCARQQHQLGLCWHASPQQRRRQQQRACTGWLEQDQERWQRRRTPSWRWAPTSQTEQPAIQRSSLSTSITHPTFYSSLINM
ncbi:hypothetical protein DFJ73DRAFT_134384 [Zopfochytrium polystomum]|nr:hypothetical protein DFJ73DRAFT_134384 [Zopfochytrium polystomum]